MNMKEAFKNWWEARGFEYVEENPYLKVGTSDAAKSAWIRQDTAWDIFAAGFEAGWDDRSEDS